jgi:hypothetical protein
MNLQSIEEAMQIKEEQTAILSSDFEISGDADSIDMTASQAATFVVNNMIAEIRRSLDYFIAQPDGVAVDGIALSGGLSRMKYLANYIEEKMGIPVELASIKSDKIEIAEELRDSIPSFIIPLGLAFQGVGLSQIAIDFLPQDIKNVRAFTENRTQLVAAVIILVLTILLSLNAGEKYTAQKNELASKLDELIRSNQIDTDQMRAAERDNRAVAMKYQRLAQVITNRKFALDFSLALLIQRPPEVLIDSLDISSNGLVRIIGVTPEQISINKFLENLETLKKEPSLIREARIEKLSSKPEPDARFSKNVWRFTLTILTRTRQGRYRTMKGQPSAAEAAAEEATTETGSGLVRTFQMKAPSVFGPGGK